jgi:hypothetical protein
MIGDFKVTCSKMVLVCFWAMKAFFYLSRWRGGEWHGFCRSLITTSFLERIFFFGIFTALCNEERFWAETERGV